MGLELFRPAIVEELGRRAAMFLPKLAAGIFVFAVFWGLSSVAGRVIRRLAGGRGFKKDILILMGRIGTSAVMAFGALTALGTMGINVSALVAGLGLTGFALGYALRDALSNVLAGIMTLAYRPFTSQDRIQVMGFEGDVVDINLRYTVLESGGKQFLLPNSVLFNNPITVLPRDVSQPAFKKR